MSAYTITLPEYSKYLLPYPLSGSEPSTVRNTKKYYALKYIVVSILMSFVGSSFVIGLL